MNRTDEKIDQYLEGIYNTVIVKDIEQRQAFHLVNAFTAFLNSGFGNGNRIQPGFYIFFGIFAMFFHIPFSLSLIHI